MSRPTSQTNQGARDTARRTEGGVTTEMLDSIAARPDEATRAELIQLAAIARAALAWRLAELDYELAPDSGTGRRAEAARDALIRAIEGAP